MEQIKDRVFIIAEAGVNHNGSIELAKKLIDAASLAGVDAVKFQTWKTEAIITNNTPQAKYQEENTANIESQFDMLKRLEISYDDFKDLKKYCDEKKILFMSTPDDIESANFLCELQDIFKIGSGELTNVPFLRHIGKFNKKLIVSTGMANLGDIENALSILIKSGTAKDNISILHATTQYPTPFEEVNLLAMKTIKRAFGLNVGYSDHTMGIEVPIAAVAMGARIIEKHFTLSRAMEGPDHKASLEPEELTSMVKAIRNITLSLGNGEKTPQKSELDNMKVVRKVIVAKEKIQVGDILNEHNITTKRNKDGLSAKLWDEVLGVEMRYYFDIDDPIRF